jgi:hypothetical protein
MKMSASSQTITSPRRPESVSMQRSAAISDRGLLRKEYQA